MTKEKIYIFDTTLRDGAQTEGVNFSIDDKKIIELSLQNNQVRIDLPKDTEFWRKNLNFYQEI